MILPRSGLSTLEVVGPTLARRERLVAHPPAMVGPGARNATGLPAGVSLPRRFGRYLLFDHIGRGGMADIYLALVETSLGPARRVVVKEILSELSRDEGFARMLIQEAKLVAGLTHANVAQVHDLGRESERLFIAMEYVEGFDLNALLRRLSQRRIGLPAEFALHVVGELLGALDYAHRAKSPGGEPLGIVHRDVSPSNVLISFEGEVKICDFGIARALGTLPAEVAARSRASLEEETGERSKLAGKAAYMSPEQARGGEVDGRADVFAAGIILWELSAGRRLYRGSEDEMLAQARAAQVPPLPDRGLPEQEKLQAILVKALDPRPEGRFQTAAEMRLALEEYAIGAGLMASPLRFGAFLSEHFEAEVVLLRRQRERAAQALDAGPALEMHALPPPEASEAASDVTRPDLEPLPREAAEQMEPAGSEAARALAEQVTASLPVQRRRRSSAWPALAIGGLILALTVLVGWLFMG